MKTLSQSNEYHGLTRTETLTNQFALYEDFLQLAYYAEEAAKIAYFYDLSAKKSNVDAQKEAKEELTKKYVLIAQKLAQIDSYKRKDEKHD